MKKGAYIALIVCLAVAFISSAVYLGSYFIEGKKQSDRYDQLATISQNAAESTAPTETAAPIETQPTAAEPAPTETTAPAGDGSNILLPYQELHKMNPDMVGWLRIDGTKLNYPVMQTSVDNRNYYLYRDFDKKDSVRGSIYAREECDVFKPSDNITLYGHNMKDGSMFACLGEYYDKATWEKNPLITFDTLYGYHVYKIFAVFKTTAVLNKGFSYHRFENAANEQEFKDFVNTCKQLSFYDTGITPAYGDKLICLSTCEYTLEDGRFVIAAVQIS